MAEQIRDPGIGEKFNARSGRVMNKDGSFNVRSSGLNLRRIHLFQYLIRVSWVKFYVLLLIAFAIVNVVFAFIYVSIPNGLKTSGDMAPIKPFWEAFFFSLHTLTTVGYGNFYPSDYATNAIAGIEAMTGLLAFAVGTGLVYGRFSRPTAKIGYSKNAIIAPFKNGNALMIRVANLRDTLMTEVHVDVMYTYMEKIGEQFIRRYYLLPLERNSVIYFPLTWTMVHHIDEKSPFYGKTAEDLNGMDSEIMVKLKGHDEGFGEHVHSRNSYLMDELVWGARFMPAFHVDETGMTLLDYDKIGAYEKMALNNELPKEKATLTIS